MIEITVNGERRSFETPPNVSELLDALGLCGKRVAVERNGEIVPASRHAEQRLEHDDRVEIVRAIGGG